MAPSTRRTAALKSDPASNGASTPPSTRAAQSNTAQKASAGLPKRRGRPAKASNMAANESVSSATTPATIISDSEYSTPATSNAVTPAPSVPAKAQAGASVTRSTRSTRSRLVIELPSDSEEEVGKPKGFSSKKKRPRRAHDSFVEDSEGDDDLGYDPSLDLARRLQREEDHKAALALAAQSSSNATRRRGARKLSDGLEASPNNSDDDIEVISENIKGKGKANAKGKGKSTAKTTAVKRSSNMILDDSDDDDTPLSQAASAHKKRKLDLFSNNADDDDSEQIALPTSDEEDPALAFVDPSASDSDDSIFGDEGVESDDSEDGSDDNFQDEPQPIAGPARPARPVPTPRQRQRQPRSYRSLTRAEKERKRLELHHPELKTMWLHLEEMPVIKAGKAEQPKSINRILKPFQLEGLAWMKAMENIEWKGGLLGDEMGLGKTIQAVSLIMSDYPVKVPSLVLVPPVALMQWTTEIASYTDGKLKTLVFHGTNVKAKNMTVKQLKEFDVILMSYNSLESLYRKQEKGFRRKDGLFKEKSAIHQIKFHRVILDEAHCIKVR